MSNPNPNPNPNSRGPSPVPRALTPSPIPRPTTPTIKKEGDVIIGAVKAKFAPTIPAVRRKRPATPTAAPIGDLNVETKAHEPRVKFERGPRPQAPARVAFGLSLQPKQEVRPTVRVKVEGEGDGTKRPPRDATTPSPAPADSPTPMDTSGEETPRTRRGVKKEVAPYVDQELTMDNGEETQYRPVLVPYQQQPEPELEDEVMEKLQLQSSTAPKPKSSRLPTAVALADKPDPTAVSSLWNEYIPYDTPGYLIQRTLAQEQMSQQPSKTLLCFQLPSHFPIQPKSKPPPLNTTGKPGLLIKPGTPTATTTKAGTPTAKPPVKPPTPTSKTTQSLASILTHGANAATKKEMAIKQEEKKYEPPPSTTSSTQDMSALDKLTQNEKDIFDPYADHAMKNVPPGAMGKLIMYRSGRVALEIGDVRYAISEGVACLFHQELIAVNISSQDAHQMGPVGKRLICTLEADHCLSNPNSSSTSSASSSSSLPASYIPRAPS